MKIIGIESRSFRVATDLPWNDKAAPDYRILEFSSRKLTATLVFSSTEDEDAAQRASFSHPLCIVQPFAVIKFVAFVLPSPSFP